MQLRSHTIRLTSGSFEKPINNTSALNTFAQDTAGGALGLTIMEVKIIPITAQEGCLAELG